MTEINGRQNNAAEDIKAMASQIREHPLQVIERVGPDGSLPFEQKSHDLMIRSVDKIAEEWVDELAHLRENSKVVEQMVVEQATKVKSELTRLHLLGAQAMREAQRGHQVLQQLGAELDAMMSDRARTQ